MLVENYIIIIYLILLPAIAIAYVNHRYIKMQTTIAIMVSSLFLSLGIIILGNIGFSGFEERVSEHLKQIKFHELLMHGLLGPLLFAGALTVDFNSLKKFKWEIATLSCISTIASTFIIGIAAYYIVMWSGVPLSFTYCLLFGALISPTDPIAVLNICKEVGAPKTVRACVSGESLFNDGVGIVLFITILEIIFGRMEPTFSAFAQLFLQEALGGIAFGALMGFVGYKLMRPVEDHKIGILITVAIATGGYTLSSLLGFSGPLSVVVAGLFIGNKGVTYKHNNFCRDHLLTFWEVLDELFNALLFIIIGFEIIAVSNQSDLIAPSALAIALVLITRFITVGIPLSLFKLVRSYAPHMIKIMVWGGIKGGLAVALALSLPLGYERDIILAMTYAVVTFSIVVQGMTFKPIIQLSQTNE